MVSSVQHLLAGVPYLPLSTTPSRVDREAVGRKNTISACRLNEEGLWKVIEIKSVTGRVLYSCEAADVRAALIEAVRRGVDLAGADLTRTNLSGVNLARADLTCADLFSADLTCADLFSVDLT